MVSNLGLRERSTQLASVLLGVSNERAAADRLRPPSVTCLTAASRNSSLYLGSVPAFTHPPQSQTNRPGASSGCFTAVTDAKRVHMPMVVGGIKPRDMPQFRWVNTVLGNLKTTLASTFHALRYCKYATTTSTLSPIASTGASICAVSSHGLSSTWHDVCRPGIGRQSAC